MEKGIDPKSNGRDWMVLGLAIASLAGYMFPLAGIALAALAIVLAYRWKLRATGSKLALAGLVIAGISIVALLAEQIYLLVTFRVG